MGYWEEKAEVSFLKNGMAGVWQINIGDQRKAAIWLCMSASLLHTIGEDPAAKPRRRRKPVR